MPAPDFTKFQRKRLNPYKGLVVDVPVWVDAHNYHREQHRLHAMSSHRHGVVTGLEVVAWSPPDNSVVIYPGIAVDPEGYTIVVPEVQRFYVNTNEKGTARMIIQYSEIAQDMTQIPGEGKAHPVHIMEAFRILEQRQRPQEPHVELARITVGDKSTGIKDADDPSQPQPNEIDTRYRTISGSRPEGEINIGLLAYPKDKPADGWDSHRQGIFNLVQSLRQSTGYAVGLRDIVELNDEIRDCDLLCMTGHQEFQLSEAEEKILLNYFSQGGVLFAEACAVKGGKERAKGFRSAFGRLCDRLGQNLRPIEREHRLFHSYHIFSGAPPGCDETALVMENDGIIYSDADYGCAWKGGREDKPLSREAIRGALEFGANIAIYSHRKARFQSIRIAGR